MKQTTVSSLLVLIAVSLAACQPQAPTAREVPTLSEFTWDDFSPFREGLVSTEQTVLDQMGSATVYHIGVQIPDDFGTLQGHQAVRYTNQEQAPLDEIYFQLFPNVAGGSTNISNLQVDGQEVEPAYEFQDSALHIPLPAPLQPGEQTVIEMDFEVAVAREMEGNYGLFGYFDEVLVLDEFYPVIPVYDDEGWNVQAPPSNGDVTYFDASFYLVRVAAPRDLVIVTGGVEVGQEYDQDTQILTLAAGPARTFYLAASEHFVKISQTLGETTVNSYAFSEYEEHAELALRVSVDALESFSQRLGPYPYTEYDAVSTPMLALGIEYPGIVGLALSAYDPEAIIAGLPSSVMLESATAHEAGHQWFYNLVGSDQVDEPWMDEALVQYITGLYYVDTYGPSAARGFRDSWDGRWASVDYAEIPIGLPSSDYDENAYGPIVYGRGPLFIEALGEEIGQETLDALLLDYAQSHRWSIGNPESFRALAEQHCACDLTALFEAWVYAQ